MDFFNNLILNMLPLYGIIALGFMGGRYLDINLHSIARINIFILLPIVSFGAVLNIKFDLAYLLLPFLLYAASWFNILMAVKLGKSMIKDETALLVGAGGANGNAIYFGLPVIFFLFNPAMAGIYLFMNLGPQLNNITAAYYLTARGQFSIRKSLLRVAQFPVVYAMILGIALNLMGVRLGDGIAFKYWQYASGAIVYMGMMMVGIALGKLEKFEFDWKLITGCFVSKFIIWPATITVFVLLDQTTLGLFSRDIHLMLMIWSAMPLFGNMVAYAAEYNLQPAKAGMAVLLSSVFVLFYIPALYMLADWLL